MSSVFEVEKWKQWANSETSLFYTLPDYGRVGFVTNASSEDILIFTKLQDMVVKVELNQLSEIKRDPVVDIVFIVNTNQFDIILSDGSFKKFSKLLNKALISVFALAPKKTLRQKDYALFMSALGLSAAPGCACGM